MIPRKPIIRIPKRKGRKPAGKDKYVSMSLKVPPDIYRWFADQELDFNRNGFIVSALAETINALPRADAPTSKGD